MTRASTNPHMPVTAIASKPRGIKAERSAHLPGAQSGDQSVKTRSIDCATRRSAEIVVDDLDVGEAAPPRDIDKLVRAPLALKVGDQQLMQCAERRSKKIRTLPIDELLPWNWRPQTVAAEAA
jgi:hypothetical protein